MTSIRAINMSLPAFREDDLAIFRKRTSSFEKLCIAGTSLVEVGMRRFTNV